MKKNAGLDSVMNLPTKWFEQAQEVGKTVYYGIADCHGIESFINAEDNTGSIGALKMRAMANAQRHAVVYVVALNTSQTIQMKALIKKEDYKRALLLLKTVERIFFLDGARSERLWGNIPDSKLDPWA